MKLMMSFFLFSALSSTAFAAEPEVRGTGPIRVECTELQGNVKVYNVNSLYYSSDTKKLIAIGFGPNRGDEGILVLEDNCSIAPNAK